ncbi:sigma-70 family RNA polymerase sigma factor [Streptomyces sp. TRM43335]|uniref:Sigma-70 family RNA polymerase sigma factor n=1 Tax=Streptomyces taklimakanensis TaxID=2569853 RepID=A0A6G2BDS8_9ACTN|nr:sigma-70 family RNA polymerase sigma factor [Streptomyces taklimakanensis]MTE20408.1 sigma-70 family RNA polymerase sigma factor [Streptomyces taklimakanensis]
MSTRREHPTHTTGAHRAHRGTHRAAARPPVRFDPYLDHLDGLYTYCLSVMCEHDAAVTVLGDALAVAERQRRRGRTPPDTALHRAWLYALARWSCLHRLTDGRGRPEPAELPGPLATERRRELAALAWPEAAGTTPEQREALELAVRHHLPVHEVAAVLGTDHDGTELLLSSGACEVERTRTALAVVDRGGCAAVARLADDRGALLGSTLRRELVRHVDECPECRRTAERVLAGGPWPGTAPVGTGALAVLPVPRSEVGAAMLAAQRARSRPTPRFDRRGFPVANRDRAERFDRLRSRAVTTTVVATVVAAPVLALWAAYRGAPPADGGPGGITVSASERRDPSTPHGGSDRAERRAGGNAGTSRDGASIRVDVDGADGADRGDGAGAQGVFPSGSHHPAHAGADGPGGRRDRVGPGRLTVEAAPAGDVTLVTLVASGGAPVDWSASTRASWLRLSRSHGTLRPGESTTITVSVDRSREPAGAWTARVAVAPAKAVITLHGNGGAHAPAEPRPSESPEAEPPGPPAEEPPEPAEPPNPSGTTPAEPSAPPD